MSKILKIDNYIINYHVNLISFNSLVIDLWWQMLCNTMYGHVELVFIISIPKHKFRQVGF